ncbi:alkene reductase [Rhizobacter sp. AJA081-3]|uniref:alkene reductase n=1 Tax=Rhizobacter sp. AJA081-3 TaxID=2753607 RepID=UPI001ADF9810|nr:alkene reductase [Rhizobacter sp. AJA081-3]QTN23135.1 alkene reductase [Rhizobacter sp. AJA081-3]
MHTLFSPFQAGDLSLANRIVMAPLTRNRALPGRIPGDLQVEYYRQRASAGLIVTEASQISPEGQGYLDTPGIYSPEQVAGWRRVTDAVHAAGGRIVIQLWHVGRISHVSLLPEGTVPVSSSAKAAKTKTFTLKGFEDVSAPRALRTDELPRIVADYRHAARCAMQAGFDGVEVHGANGYLLEQFLRDSINDRSDTYGGSIENRARLLLEVMQAVVGEVGAGRTGLRLSPVTPANDAAQDSDAAALYGHVVDRLAPMKLAFLHLIEGATGGPRDAVPFDFEALRQRFKRVHPAGAWMVNNGYDRAMALDVVARGAADLVAFGKAFIANPDLVRRLREDAPLNLPRRETFYGGGAAGYTDYPALETSAA